MIDDTTRIEPDPLDPTNATEPGELPEAPEVPGLPESPESPESPETPDSPEAPDFPETPDSPEAPDLPEVPDEAPFPREIPDAPQPQEVPDRDVPEMSDERARSEVEADADARMDDDGAPTRRAERVPPAASGDHGEEAGSPAGERPPAPAEGPITVGRMVADALRRAGVRWAFTVPGESFLGLLDGFEGAGINVVATRHEGSAAFMAEAHAQLTGRPAAAVGTRAVGAANLAIGIHTAFADSSPMFALVGQVATPSRGREGFQEVELATTIGGLARWAAEPGDPDEAVTAARDAVAAVMTGRPGPALLVLREDLLDAALPAGTVASPARITPPRASDDEIRDVLQLLASAERPVIVAGAGVLRARTSNDLARLAELLRVPVVASWRRGDVISNDDPLYLGMTGYGSPSVVRERLERADAMLVVGCRLSEVTSYGWSIPAEGTRWAHVDVDPVRPHPDLRPADIVVRSDARLFLRGAVTRLESRGVLAAEIADRRAATNAEDRAAWEKASVVDDHPWSGPGVHPGRVVATLRAVLPDEAILATDAGNFAGWAARGFRFRRPGTFLGPTSGAMGYGLPAAIAAGLVHRDRPVVALVGDGGLGMTLTEIETAVRTGLRTIVVVFDNEQYGMIRAHQDRREGGTTAATDLGPIDFAAAARTMGARGVKVETDAAFEPALRQALASDRPTVLHLVVDRRWVNVDSRP